MPFAYSATINHVHDGDTVNVDLCLSRAGRRSKGDIDLGFNIHRRDDGLWLVNQAVRLFGCNAPELASMAGAAARDFLVAMLPAGTQVHVLSHGWDKYGGRIDGSLTTIAGVDVVQQLIASGHAAPWDGRGSKPVPG